MITLTLDHFPHSSVESVVIDGVGELVARLGARIRRQQLEIDLEPLARLLFIGAGAMVPEDGQALEANGRQVVASKETPCEASRPGSAQLASLGVPPKGVKPGVSRGNAEIATNSGACAGLV